MFSHLSALDSNLNSIAETFEEPSPLPFVRKGRYYMTKRDNINRALGILKSIKYNNKITSATMFSQKMESPWKVITEELLVSSPRFTEIVNKFKKEKTDRGIKQYPTMVSKTATLKKRKS